MPSSPLLFLSHAGEDGAAAREMARRLRDAGVDVWLDLDDLKPGNRWMEALKEALTRASAFAVYVGRSGVARWVDREVRLALDRNIREPSARIGSVEQADMLCHRFELEVSAAGVSPSASTWSAWNAAAHDDRDGTAHMRGEL